MGASGTTTEPTGDEAMCAVCDQPVVSVVGTPSRQRISASTTVYAPRAWCVLEPCGHAFAVRRGGLIY